MQEREQFEQEQKEQAEIRNATTMQAMEDASLLERAKSELSPEVYDIYELSLLKNSYYSNSNNTFPVSPYKDQCIGKHSNFGFKAWCVG